MRQGEICALDCPRLVRHRFRSADYQHPWPGAPKRYAWHEKRRKAYYSLPSRRRGSPGRARSWSRSSRDQNRPECAQNAVSPKRGPDGQKRQLRSRNSWAAPPCPSSSSGGPDRRNLNIPTWLRRVKIHNIFVLDYLCRVCGRARLSSDVSEIKLRFAIPPGRPAPNLLRTGTSRRAIRFRSWATRTRSATSRSCAGAWCRSGRRTSRSASRISTPRPKASRPSPPSAKRSATALPGSGRQFLRMEKDRDGEAALRDRARRSADHGAGGVVGLALAGGRADPQLRDRHHDPERIVRRDPQPDVRGADARDMAARLSEEPAELPELKTLLAPCPSDEMVARPVSPRIGNVRNHDPDLIEPIILA
jgi:hypothetical protein